MRNPGQGNRSSSAKRHWQQARVAGKIELSLGPALRSLMTQGEDGRFDIAFIDADKENLLAYHQRGHTWCARAA